MFVVPNFPHLKDIEMIVNYRELIEEWVWPPRPGKFLQDPDYDPSIPYQPQPDYYANGVLVRRGQIKRSRVSSTPFPVNRVPRRGFQVVHPHEADYAKLAQQQGLHHLVPEELSNQQTQESPQINGGSGITPPHSEKSKSIEALSPVIEEAKLPNGVHHEVLETSL